MNADTNLLMGEIIEDPSAQPKDVEKLISGFLAALCQEKAHKDQMKQSSEEPQQKSESAELPQTTHGLEDLHAQSSQDAGSRAEGVPGTRPSGEENIVNLVPHRISP